MIEMDKEIRKEAFKQYLHYFRIWFIILGILIVLFVAAFVWTGLIHGNNERGNMEAPAQRVYDYANVLTGSERENLELYISKCEEEYRIDLVLVTIEEPIEEKYSTWEYGMRNLADDFYDEHNFGFDKVHGDGALLLDNWYEGQEGSWFSTCGSVYAKFGNYDIECVLDAVDAKIGTDPYAAYKAYVDETCRRMKGVSDLSIPWAVIILFPLAVGVIYAICHLNQKKAEDTTRADTYVSNSSNMMRSQNDAFLRKSLTKRKIETSSSSGGGGGHGGGHISSGGVSHGGGGHRR